MFGERAVAGTALSDIVKAARVAQGTFYPYFDSKDLHKTLAEIGAESIRGTDVVLMRNREG